MTEQDIIDNRIEELKSVKLPCDINFINGKVGKGCTLYTLQLRILNHGRALQGWIDKLQARLEEIGKQEPVGEFWYDEADNDWGINLRDGVRINDKDLLYTHAPDSAARIAELEAENAELRKDAERLDWLLEHPDATICSDGPHGTHHIWFRYSNRVTGEYPTKRAAIDATKGGV